MTWIKQNKFLTGFLIVMLAGVGAFGWLLFSAKGKYDDAAAAYETQKNDRNRLHNLVPYPSAVNLKTLQEEKAQAVEAIDSLQKSLAANQLPLEAITPEKFQDDLRTAVNEVKGLAGPRIPPGNKFYLGFDKYETAPPDKDATGPLARQLKTIVWVIEKFIDANAIEIRELKRDELPEEAGRAKTAKEEKTAAGSRSRTDKGTPKGDAGGKPLVTKSGFDLTVLADQEAIRKALNAIVASTEHFLIPRVVEIRSDNPKAPSRGGELGAPEPAPAAPPGTAPNPAGAAAGEKFIVGEERVILNLRLEAANFADVASK